MAKLLKYFGVAGHDSRGKLSRRARRFGRIGGRDGQNSGNEGFIPSVLVFVDGIGLAPDSVSTNQDSDRGKERHRYGKSPCLYRGMPGLASPGPAPEVGGRKMNKPVAAGRTILYIATWALTLITPVVMFVIFFAIAFGDQFGDIHILPFELLALVPLAVVGLIWIFIKRRARAGKSN